MKAAPAAALPLLLVLSSTSSAQDAAPTVPIVTQDDARSHGLESLFTLRREEGVPLPENLGQFVRNGRIATQLGKALFFEMGVGSDGIQACATCHFHAGADSRFRNQVTPGLLRHAGDRMGDAKGFFFSDPAADTNFEVRQPNQALQRSDFPFVRDIGDGDNVVEIGGVQYPAPGNSNDAASSQGVELTEFVSVNPGELVDDGIPLFDPVFNSYGMTVRRVEPRNTPTMINAVFNFFNFWDGRADDTFNGVNPFGHQDPDAKVFRSTGPNGTIQRVKIELKHSSLASQAVGPPLSDFEMSFAGRTFPELGRKMLPMRALSTQDVHPQDSILASLRHPVLNGLTKTYEEFVRAAFHPQWWASNRLVYYPPSGDPMIVDPEDGTDPDRTFTLMEANFSLFYGLAVMGYEVTLIADRTPFDRWLESSDEFVPGFGPAELAGLNVFVDQGKCIACHSGPELTGASVRNAQNGKNVIEPMVMGDGRPAMYDNGFYNIGVTPTLDDLARGGANGNGQPLASSRQLVFEALGIMDIPFDITGAPIPDLVSSEGDPDVLGLHDEGTGEFIPVCRDLDGDGECGEDDELLLVRNAVDGSFKTPGLRNVELTGPYFHNGGMATLMEVVEFYDRGGNFCRLNKKDLDPDIQPLGLSSSEKENLVRFLIALTDPRVAREQAPFDRPSLRIPNGEAYDGTQLFIDLPAVGANGRPGGGRIGAFLGANQFHANHVAGGDCSADF